jgi:hypothetical protein
MPKVIHVSDVDSRGLLVNDAGEAWNTIYSAVYPLDEEDFCDQCLVPVRIGSVSALWLYEIPASLPAGEWSLVVYDIHADGSPPEASDVPVRTYGGYWTGSEWMMDGVGTLVADIWSHATRRLSDRTTGDGSEIASQSTANNIKAKTDLLGTASLTCTGPAYGDENVTINGGSSYTAAEGTALPFRAEGLTVDLAGATAKLLVLDRETYTDTDTRDAVLVSDADITADGDAWRFDVDLTAAQTATLAPHPPANARSHQYQIVATTPSGGVHLVGGGVLTVRKQLADPT